MQNKKETSWPCSSISYHLHSTTAAHLFFYPKQSSSLIGIINALFILRTFCWFHSTISVFIDVLHQLKTFTGQIEQHMINFKYLLIKFVFNDFSNIFKFNKGFLLTKNRVKKNDSNNIGNLNKNDNFAAFPLHPEISRFKRSSLVCWKKNYTQFN